MAMPREKFAELTGEIDRQIKDAEVRQDIKAYFFWVGCRHGVTYVDVCKPIGFARRLESEDSCQSQMNK